MTDNEAFADNVPIPILPLAVMLSNTVPELFCHSCISAVCAAIDLTITGTTEAELFEIKTLVPLLVPVSTKITSDLAPVAPIAVGLPLKPANALAPNIIPDRPFQPFPV